MDELIKYVTKKTGLPEDQAKAAAAAVVDYLKKKLPGPVGSQIDGLLSGGGVSAATGALGGLFGKKK